MALGDPPTQGEVEAHRRLRKLANTFHKYGDVVIDFRKVAAAEYSEYFEDGCDLRACNLIVDGQRVGIEGKQGKQAYRDFCEWAGVGE